MTSIIPKTRDLVQPVGIWKADPNDERVANWHRGRRECLPKVDSKTVAALGTNYQAAVKSNDAVAMHQARKKQITNEHQDDEPGPHSDRLALRVRSGVVPAAESRPN